MKTVREENIVKIAEWLYSPQEPGSGEWFGARMIQDLIFDKEVTGFTVESAIEAIKVFTTAKAKHEAEIGELLDVLELANRHIIKSIDEAEGCPYDNCIKHTDGSAICKYEECIHYEASGEIAKLLSTYKKTTVPCEECEIIQHKGGITERVFASCKGKGTVERWEKIG